MTLRLRVDRSRWLRHVDAMFAAVSAAGELVPVVKGNGYGFGRDRLAAEASPRASLLAVGTLHEAAGLGRGAGSRTGHDGAVLVLTPPVRPVPAGLDDVVVTVGNTAQADAVATHTGPVAVKLRSSMHRYGATPRELAPVLDRLSSAGRAVHSFVLHPPLLGEHRSERAQRDEIEAWEALLPPGVPLSVSHVGVGAFVALAAARPARRWQLRAGTALWHGDKSFVHLGADVVEVREVAAGTTVGYRAAAVPGDGWLVMVGAGSAHGVTELADGRSPFHHARRRLTLVEPPHMHTSMCFVPAADAPPRAGDWVDVQRPLISVHPDVVDDLPTGDTGDTGDTVDG